MPVTLNFSRTLHHFDLSLSYRDNRQIDMRFNIECKLADRCTFLHSFDNFMTTHLFKSVKLVYNKSILTTIKKNSRGE
jgi:hypothetical protein